MFKMFVSAVSSVIEGLEYYWENPCDLSTVDGNSKSEFRDDVHECITALKKLMEWF